MSKGSARRNEKKTLVDKNWDAVKWPKSTISNRQWRNVSRALIQWIVEWIGKAEPVAQSRYKDYEEVK